MPNPAYISTKNILQVDLIGFVESTRFNGFPRSFFINAIGSVESINSNVRVSYNHYSLLSSKENSFYLGYSYQHSINEDFGLYYGISFEQIRLNSKSNWKPADWFGTPPSSTVDGIDRVEQVDNYADFGLRVDLYDFSFGIDYKYAISLKTRDIYISGNDTIVNDDYSGINFLSTYQFSLIDKISLTPVISVDFLDILEKKDYEFHWGALMEYDKLIGLGVILGEETSIIGSLNYKDVFKFNMLLYRKWLFFTSNIYEKDRGWNLMRQITFCF